MQDKELIKKNFKKSLVTYDNNAIIQKKMAKKLLLELGGNSFENILEIGSYSGGLTKEIVKTIDFKSYLALDIIDSFDFIKNLDSRIRFQNADIESFETSEKFDLIIANASLQWCDDFKNIIFKLKSFLKKNGVIAISIFGKENFLEIKNTFNIGLEYPDEKDLEKIFSKNAKIIKEKRVLQFENPKDILKHMKYTGVNSISKKKLSFVEIKEKLKALNEVYENKLTYEPLYVIDCMY